MTEFRQRFFKKYLDEKYQSTSFKAEVMKIFTWFESQKETVLADFKKNWEDNKREYFTAIRNERDTWYKRCATACRQRDYVINLLAQQNRSVDFSEKSKKHYNEELEKITFANVFENELDGLRRENKELKELLNAKK